MSKKVTKTKKVVAAKAVPAKSKSPKGMEDKKEGKTIEMFNDAASGKVQIVVTQNGKVIHKDQCSSKAASEKWMKEYKTTGQYPIQKVVLKPKLKKTDIEEMVKKGKLPKIKVTSLEEEVVSPIIPEGESEFKYRHKKSGDLCKIESTIPEWKGNGRPYYEMKSITGKKYIVYTDAMEQYYTTI